MTSPQRSSQAAVHQARLCNEQQDLSPVRIGAYDEIFQSGRPVLVGGDTNSTCCYLLSLEDHRDAETWGVRLLDLRPQGFQPEAIIGDAGSGRRAGLTLAMPEVPCRGDVFHILQSVQSLRTFLEKRAHQTIDATATLERKKARLNWKGRSTLPMKLLAKRSAPVRWSRTSTAACATTSFYAATSAQTTWRSSSSFSTNGVSHGATGPSEKEKAPRNCSAAAPFALVGNARLHPLFTRLTCSCQPRP